MALSNILSVFSSRSVLENSLVTFDGHSDWVLSLVVLPNGLLASSSRDKTIKLWDTMRGNCIKLLEGHRDYIHPLVAFSNGQLASGSRDKTIKIWDTVRGTCLRTLEGHRRYVRSLVVLRNGQLASGSNDHMIKIWDTELGNCVRTLKGHTSSVLCLKEMLNGQLASGSRDMTIRLWDGERGVCMQVLQGHTNWVTAIVLLPNGQLATSSNDRTIKLWDIERGYCVRTLEGHRDWVLSIVLLSNGNLVSGSRDKTLRLWDTERVDCARTLEGHRDSVFALARLPNGQVASGSADKSIKIWDMDGLLSHPIAHASTSQATEPGASGAASPGTIPIESPASNAVVSPVMTPIGSTVQLSTSTAATISKSSLRNDAEIIGETDYRGVIRILEGYHPPRSCAATMREDLQPLFPQVPMEFVVEDCTIVVGDRQQRLAGVSHGLNEDEALAVVAYTYDLGINSNDEGRDNLFYPLNMKLRERSSQSLSTMKPFLCYLMRGLCKLPSFDGVVYRGIPIDHLAVIQTNYLEGMFIHWSGFTSTTTNISVAKGDRFAGAGGIVFHIKCRTGKQISSYSFIRNEEEILLLPNAKFMVSQACCLGEDGYFHLHLVERRDAGFVF